MSETKSISYARGASLRREVGPGGAVMLGLGSMLGTGVFFGLPESTHRAGLWVLLAILLAGGLALCNALSSAQLAAKFPVAGGTYEYGYRTLSPAWGFTAGWTFLLAKSASAAAAAMGAVETIDFVIVAELHDWYGKDSSVWFDLALTLRNAYTLFALVAVVMLSLAVLFGLRRTVHLNAVLLCITLYGLIAIPVTYGREIRDGMRRVGVEETLANLSRWFANESVLSSYVSPFEFLSVVAIMFVAFTGYGRLATLGEEVRNPARTIPRAIVLTIAIVVTLYGLIACALLPRYYPSAPNIDSYSPLLRVGIDRASYSLTAIIAVAAVTAMLGVLLNLILGLSRVWLAMGRRGDMPGLFSMVNPKTSTPTAAVIVSGAMISILVLVGDWRVAWAFSAFSVLIYYAITNAAALRLPRTDRLFSPLISWIGLISCISLAWFVPWRVWAVGTMLILLGLLWHRLRRPFRESIANSNPHTANTNPHTANAVN